MGGLGGRMIMGVFGADSEGAEGRERVDGG